MAKRNVDIILRGHDRASREIRSTTGATDALTRSLRGVKLAAIAATGAVIAIRAVKSVIGGLGESIELFAQQEQAERKLATSLALVGDTSRGALESMKAFASEIQRTTTIGDEAVLELASLGATLGQLSGQQLQDATRAAIGLSQALGIDTTAAMRLVSRAAVGDTASLKRYGLQLDETLGPQEKFNELLRIGGRNFVLAEAEAQTHAGAMEQFKNVVGDLKEEFGAALAPAVRAVTVALLENKEVVRGVLDIFSTFSKIVTTQGVKVFTALDLGGRVMAQGLKVSFISASLVFVGFIEDVKHMATVTIQTLAVFASNWRGVLDELFAFTKTVFLNLTANVVRIITSIPDLIAGKISFGDLWTPLTTGFEAELLKLPEIAARGATGLEKMLKRQFAGATGDFGEAVAGLGTFDQLVHDRLVAAGIIGGAPLPVPSGVSPPGVEALEVKIDETSIADLTNSVRGQNDPLIARFLTQAPGQDIVKKTETNTKKTADNTAKQIAQQDRLIATLELIASNPIPVFGF